MTDPDLNALLDAATPGPWEFEDDAPGACRGWVSPEYVFSCDSGDRDYPSPHNYQANAALIVAAVNALPRLLEIERAARAAMKWPWSTYGPSECPMCEVYTQAVGELPEYGNEWDTRFVDPATGRMDHESDCEYRTLRDALSSRS